MIMKNDFWKSSDEPFGELEETHGQKRQLV